MSDVQPQPACETDLPGALDTHRGWLRSVIVARLGEAGAAEDVLQEVNLAAIEGKSPLRDQRSVASWLYQLAVRKVLQFRRAAGRQRKRIGDAAAVEETRERESGDPLAWMLNSERRQLIREGLSRLSGEDREMLMLKYVEGWSYRQIAERTGRTESAVESKLHRARVGLREHLVRLDVIEKRGES